LHMPTVNVISTSRHTHFFTSVDHREHVGSAHVHSLTQKLPIYLVNLSESFRNKPLADERGPKAISMLTHQDRVLAAYRRLTFKHENTPPDLARAEAFAFLVKQHLKAFIQVDTVDTAAWRSASNKDECLA
jgi:hypothetical protein